MEKSVKFTHQSVIEFLKSDETKQKLASELNTLDIFDAISQTFLAHIQAVVMNEHYYHGIRETFGGTDRFVFCPEHLVQVLRPRSLDYDICTILRAYTAKDVAADSARFTVFLDNLVEVAEVLLSPQASFQLCDDNWEVGTTIQYTLQVRVPVRVGLFTALYGMADYALQTDSIGLDGLRELVTLRILVLVICQGAEGSLVVRDRICKGLNTILNAYLDLDLNPNGPSMRESMSCWHYMLMQSITAADRRPYVSFIASFLLH